MGYLILDGFRQQYFRQQYDYKPRSQTLILAAKTHFAHPDLITKLSVLCDECRNKNSFLLSYPDSDLSELFFM